MDKSIKVTVLKNEQEEETSTLNIKNEIYIGAHKGMVRSVNLSQDSKELLTAGQDNNLKLWDVERRELNQKFMTSCNHVNHLITNKLIDILC